MPSVLFTDTLTVKTVSSTIGEETPLYAQACFEVTAPLSAWTDHTDPGFAFGPIRVDPVFYVPGPDPALSAGQRYLLRGTLETVAEDVWAAYTALLDAGVAPALAVMVLPSNVMVTRKVTASALALARFVCAHRNYTPGAEVAVIAGGYAAHLGEHAPELLNPINPKKEEESL